MVEGNLTELAADPDAFHATLNTSFGSGYDKGAAETIRQQVLAGDFSWLPNIELVDGASLGDTSGTQGAGQGLGAYSAENDTIYLSKELVATDPDKAASILTEEIGHGLDTRLNVSDSAGDEGDIFAALVEGKELSDSDLAALKAENDSGTIMIDGKKVEVEYGWNPFKKIKKTFDKVVDVVTAPFKAVADIVVDHVNSVVDLVKDAVDSIKSAFKTIIQSELLGTIMSVLQYVPIPIIAAVATVYNVARAGYAIYQGVKNGSISQILGGVAGVAGGAAKLGAAFGASEKFIKGATTIATRADQASKLYAARSDLNFQQALSIGADLFGGTKAGPYFQAAERGVAAHEAVKSGDVLGGIALGADAFAALPGGRYDETLGEISSHAVDGRAIVQAVRQGDYASAIAQVNERYGTTLGLDQEGREAVDNFTDVLGAVQTAAELASSKNDYFGAAELLLNKAAEHSSSPAVSERLESGAAVFEQLGEIKTNFDKGRLEKATEQTLALLEQPLDTKTRETLLGFLGRLDQLRGTDEASPSDMPIAA